MNDNDLNDSTLRPVRGRFLLGMQPEALNYNILCARQVRGYNHRGPAGLCRPERHQESLKVHRQGEGCAQGLSVLGFRERCRLSLHRHNRVTAPRIVSGCLCTGYRHFSLSGTRRHPHRSPHLHRQCPLHGHHSQSRHEMDRPL